MQAAIAVLLMLVASCVPAAWCPIDTHCNCDYNRSDPAKRTVSCNFSNSSLTIEISLSEHLHFQCSSTTASEYSLLKGLATGPVKSINFLLCPLPASPFMNLTQTFGAGNISILEFQSYHNLSDSLSADQFHGLHLSKLRLMNNGFTSLPPSLLKDQPALTFLELRYNFLKGLPSAVFSHVPQLKLLDLGNNRIEFLEPGIFQGLTSLKYLYLWGNRLRHLDEQLFDNLTTLEILDLRGNELQDLPSDLFSDCDVLKDVDLSRNDFTRLSEGLFNQTASLATVLLRENKNNLTLPNGLFANLLQLKKADLKGSKLKDLPEGLFFGSSSLTTLFLSSNRLTTLPVRLLKDQSNLQELDLSYNLLESIPDDFFHNLTSLRTLRLQNNSISTISSDMFKGLKNLIELNMNRNQLLHIDSYAFNLNNVPNLQNAFFSHNMLTLGRSNGLMALSENDWNSPFFSLLSLKNLDLSHNFISDICYDWRITLQNLTSLDLSHNVIDSLQSSDINFLSPKITVNLSHNNISRVWFEDINEIFASNNRHGEPAKIILNDNPLDCNCEVLELLQFSRGELDKVIYDMANIILEDVHCSAPPDLKGYKFRELFPKRLLCQLAEKSCPTGCDCWYQRYDRGLIVDCASRNLSEVPRSLPTPAPRFHNHTHLHLENNSITRLPLEMQPGYSFVTELFLQGNKLSKIETALLSRNLTNLRLDGNSISSLTNDSMEFLDSLPSLMITLQANHWRCDCNSKAFVSWMQKKHLQIKDFDKIFCSDGRLLSGLTANDLCPMELAIVVSCAVLAALGVICGAVAALYYKHSHSLHVWLYAHGWFLWYVTEDELDKDKLYDAFVCYSEKDKEFVVKILVPKLESFGLKLCIHTRDWIPGESIFTHIVQSVEASRRTLIVLSPNFLKSVWGKTEFQIAHKKALDDGRARVVMVVYGDVPAACDLDPELQAYISVNTYIQYNDTSGFWDNLRYALPHAPLAKSMKKENHINLVLTNGKPINNASGYPVIPQVLFPPSAKAEKLEVLA